MKEKVEESSQRMNEKEEDLMDLEEKVANTQINLDEKAK